ncbi:hypothetical protein [Streptomyces sp. NPDC127038]|uniref:hypothetical protein n=1 Tax=Streptomyces sp. NPDC127038 TaxID=3347114 RepID=UPI0036566A0C
MLHQVTLDGGLGFCNQVLPSLLPSGYHGPLVVALDSNVLIDLQQHGTALMNDDSLPDEVEADAAYLEELDGLADILNVWLLRDIRFVVTPRSKTDAKKVSERFLERRLPSIEALAESLAFQMGDWTISAPSDGPAPTPVGDESGLPEGADRDLVLEAQAIGAHVFLTRDRLVLDRTVLVGPAMALLSPAGLEAYLAAAGVQLFLGGTCGSDGCPYTGWPFPAPDMGKWGGLLSILGSS